MISNIINNNKTNKQTEQFNTQQQKSNPQRLPRPQTDRFNPRMRAPHPAPQRAPSSRIAPKTASINK
jgi:hypothetical protein